MGGFSLVVELGQGDSVTNRATISSFILSLENKNSLLWGSLSWQHVEKKKENMYLCNKNGLLRIKKNKKIIRIAP